MSRQLQANTSPRHHMRGGWCIGAMVVALLALSSHGESPRNESKAPAAEQPADAKTVPADLDALNVTSRKMYADARARELATIPVVIVVSGDELVLRKNGKRTVV